MNISLGQRIGLCVLSGSGVALFQIFEDNFDWLNEGVIFCALSGLVFAAGVLFPYLKRHDRFFVRALALVIASSASYYSAVWLALEGPFAGDNEWVSFTIASVAGAAIVLIALAWMMPVRATPRFALAGLIAGLIGGPVTFLTLPEDHVLIVLGHTTWHILICLAIYFSTRNEGRTEVS
jgi:hypothetical protein